MKTVVETAKDAVSQRMKNLLAEDAVRKGSHKYCPKKLWKEQVRDLGKKQKEAEEAKAREEEKQARKEKRPAKDNRQHKETR